MKKLLIITILVLFGRTVFSQTHWTPVTGIESTMSVTGVIIIDGVEQQSNQLEIGAFCGDECRGAKKASYNPVWHRYTVPISICGNDGDIIVFRIFNHDPEVNTELDLQSLNTITFVTNAIIGNTNATAFQFAFTTPSTSQTYTLNIEGYGAGNAGGYHLIASPVTEAITPSTENGFISSNFDLYYFDQNGDDEYNEWINYKAEDYEQNGTINPNFGNIVSGKGYLYASEGGTTLQFTGTAYSGDGVIPLVYSETNPDATMHGWNLIGNPFLNENGAIIDRAGYKMKADGTDLEAFDANTVIPAMNGVFVKATEEGENVTFAPNVVNNSNAAKIVVNVLKDRGVAMDRAIVRFDNSSTLPKFMLNPDNTKVYIPQGGEDYAVVNSNIENSMPVNFKASEDGNYTLKIEVNDVRMEYLHLIDNKTGADVDLLVQPDYQFSATNHDYESRFTLVFKAMTGVNEQTQQTFCFVNGRNLYFCEDVEGADFSLVDMTGRTLCNKVLKGNGVDLSSLSQGVYVVRLTNGNDVKVQKVVVR